MPRSSRPLSTGGGRARGVGHGATWGTRQKGIGMSIVVTVPAHPRAADGDHPLPGPAEPGAGRLQGRRNVSRAGSTATRGRGHHRPRGRTPDGGPHAPRELDAPQREQAAHRTWNAVAIAATEVFVQEGYAGATIEQIASRTGVSRPTVQTVCSAHRTRPCVIDQKPRRKARPSRPAITGDNHPPSSKYEV